MKISLILHSWGDNKYCIRTYALGRMVGYLIRELIEHGMVTFLV